MLPASLSAIRRLFAAKISAPASPPSFRTAAICFAKKFRARSLSATVSAKLMGSTQVNELGEIETPILLTSTLARSEDRRFPDRLYARASRQRRCPIDQPAGRGNKRRISKRHSRAAYHARRCFRGDQKCENRCGRGRLGRRGNRHSRLWLEGRHRHVFAKTARKVLAATRSVFWFKRISAGCCRSTASPVGVELGKYYLKERDVVRRSRRPQSVNPALTQATVRSSSSSRPTRRSIIVNSTGLPPVDDRTRPNRVRR